MKAIAPLLVIAACTTASAPSPSEPGHDARFIGLWAVEQPFHGSYEVTYYELASDGAVAITGQFPGECGGEQECVTGTVAACVGVDCTSNLTCAFGNEWFSRNAVTLVIVGTCSDGVDREIELSFNADASSNTEFGGSGGTLVSVAGDTGWSHTGFEWAFRKCEGADVSACAAF